MLVTLGDTVKMHGSVRVKARTPGERRPFVEGKYGDDLHRASGTWSRLWRTIDRRRNRYQERIVDADGAVVRDVDEPLTDHRGRGSAKRKPNGG